METITKNVKFLPGITVFHVGTPVDTNGKVANDATAIGIIIEDVIYPNKTAIIMTAGTFNVVDGYAHSGIIISGEAAKAMADIEFVDEQGNEWRFNATTDAENFPGGGGGSGSGLPDPSTLSDGTAAIVVNGEWKMQEGYGYTGDPAFEPITWDGDTEGREPIDFDGTPAAFKISDEILTAAQINGATMVLEMAGETAPIVLSDEYIEDIQGCVVAWYVISGISGTYTSETFGEFVIPYDGTYFYNADGVHVASLTAPSSVHQFDPALIPSSGVDEFIVTIIDNGDDTYTADKSFEEIEIALSEKKIIKGILASEYSDFELSLDATEFFFYSLNFDIQANRLTIVSFVLADEEYAWNKSEKVYTLTPAT